jgi:hypothetical protein
VDGEVEDLPVPVEDVLGAVAVVDVPVEHGDPPDPEGAGVRGGHRRVVEEAEAHGVVRPGVVARRAHDGEGGLTRQRAVHRGAGGPGGERGDLEGARPERRVGVEVAAPRSESALSRSTYAPVWTRIKASPPAGPKVRRSTGRPARPASSIPATAGGEPPRYLDAGERVDVVL